MRQLRDDFRKLKAANTGYILAFGLGDFFEFRYCDASDIHEALPDVAFDDTVEYPRIKVHKLGIFQFSARLAAKTTCKDRWRQILNEAIRFKDKTKYLCTLQQGISFQQMQEMSSEKVVLVVPRPYISYYPHESRKNILDIERFVGMAKKIQGAA